jgi:serine/threonine protein phosphatase 1
MNRKLVIGDIHGGLKALKQVLERANVTQNDTLIFLGDYVDGWSQSPQVLDFLMELEQKQKCIFIRGNHDDLLLNYLKTNTYNEEWFKHGGKSTVDAYANVGYEIRQKHISFLEKLLLYHLDEMNRLFIHAGFTNLKGVAFEFFKPLFYWDRTLWEMVLALDERISVESDLYPSRLKLYHEIYIGHTPTTKINQKIPVNKAGVWNVDTGAAFFGSLTILDINTKEFYQSDALTELYPDEKGRN